MNNRKSPFSRELILLSAPLLLLVSVAFWAMRRPKPVQVVPKKWRVEGKLMKRIPAPEKVRRGVDTEFTLQFDTLSPNDNNPRTQGSSWRDIRLVATDEKGQEYRVWDFNRRFYAFNSSDWKQIDRLFFGGEGGGGGESWGMTYRFALRRLPHPTHKLELRVDSVWRPVKTMGMVMDATPGMVAQQRALPDALSTSQRWVLRKAGEQTPTPRVSTNPLFDIKGVEFHRAKDISGGPGVQVRWPVYWQGALKPKRFWVYVPASLSICDEKNQLLGTNSNNTLETDWKKGRSFSVSYSTELKWLRTQAKDYGSKALFVKGWISINGHWPRQVKVKLPNWVLQAKPKPPTKRSLTPVTSSNRT